MNGHVNSVIFVQINMIQRRKLMTYYDKLQWLNLANIVLGKINKTK